MLDLGTGPVGAVGAAALPAGRRGWSREYVHMMPLFVQREHCRPPSHLVLLSWQTSQALQPRASGALRLLWTPRWRRRTSLRVKDRSQIWQVNEGSWCVAWWRRRCSLRRKPLPQWHRCRVCDFALAAAGPGPSWDAVLDVMAARGMGWDLSARLWDMRVPDAPTRVSDCAHPVSDLQPTR